jgi:selenocysteine lyase/cysteine desulfurase
MSDLTTLALDIVGHDLTLVTAYGPRRMLYADWIASGRLYRPIEDRMLQAFGPWMANSHTETSATGQAMTLAYAQARSIVKRHVNASADDVLLATGTGAAGAINKLQRLLGLRVPSNFIGHASVLPAKRPLVLVTHMEHHSNQTSRLECAADVKVIPPAAEGLVDVAAIPAILARYADRPLKIAAVTACSKVTGIHTPYHEIAALMHAHGGLCFVDFACSAPYVDIDTHPADAAQRLDAIYFSPHKFLGWPGASGILVFAQSLYTARVPDQPGGGTVAWTDPWQGRRYFEDIETGEDGGTLGILQLIRAALAVQLKEAMGTARMAERERAIVRRVFAQLAAVPRVVVLAAQHRERLPSDQRPH